MCRTSTRSNASEDITVSAAADRHVRVTRNIANIAMDLANVEEWSVRTLAGTDNVTINDLTGTPLKKAPRRPVRRRRGRPRDAQRHRQSDKVNLTREGDTVIAAGLPTITYITGSEAASDTVHLDVVPAYVAPGVLELIKATWPV